MRQIPTSFRVRRAGDLYSWGDVVAALEQTGNLDVGTATARGVYKRAHLVDLHPAPFGGRSMGIDLDTLTSIARRHALVFVVVATLDGLPETLIRAP